MYSPATRFVCSCPDRSQLFAPASAPAVDFLLAPGLPSCPFGLLPLTAVPSAWCKSPPTVSLSSAPPPAPPRLRPAHASAGGMCLVHLGHCSANRSAQHPVSRRVRTVSPWGRNRVLWLGRCVFRCIRSRRCSLSLGALLLRLRPLTLGLLCRRSPLPPRRHPARPRVRHHRCRLPLRRHAPLPLLAPGARRRRLSRALLVRTRPVRLARRRRRAVLPRPLAQALLGLPLVCEWRDIGAPGALARRPLYALVAAPFTPRLLTLRILAPPPPPLVLNGHAASLTPY